MHELLTAIAARWAELRPIELLNAALAFGGALVALGAANRMSRATEKTIIVSFALTGAGLIGYGASTLWPNGWQTVCDTVLLGGITALLVGTRKATRWIRPEWMPRLSAGVSVATVVAFLWGVR